MIAKPTDYLSDPIKFNEQMKWYHNQLTQDEQNQKAHDQFVLDSASWLVANQQAQDYGRAVTPAPPVPQKVTYNDDMTISYTNFPDLKAPVLQSSIPHQQGLTGLVPTGTPVQLTQDQKLDLIISMLANAGK